MIGWLDALIHEADWALRYLHSLTWAEFAFFFLPVLVLDIPRTLFVSIAALMDHYVWSHRHDATDFVKRLRTHRAPLVSMIAPGLNESETIEKTCVSLLEQDYPNKEIIIVDDGSDDGMTTVCRRLQKRFGNRIKFVCLRPRQGKSAAINFGISVASGEYVMTVDADGTYDRDAVSKAMKQFADPRVAVVSGNVRVRNAFACLLTRVQSIEYLFSINLARRFLARTGTLLIASGAFGLFRRSVVEGVGKFTVGPGEDRELTVRVHKAGYRAAFAGDAICMTDAPTSLKVLTKQRLRWNRSPIRCQFRMHRDLYRLPAFSNMTTMAFLDWTLYSMVLLFSRFMFWGIIAAFHPHLFFPIFIGTGILYGLTNLVQLGVAVWISERKARDLGHLPFMPLFPFYKLYFGCVRAFAYIDEMLFETSYTDNFVPPYVRREALRSRDLPPTEVYADKPRTWSQGFKVWARRRSRDVALEPSELGGGD